MTSALLATLSLHLLCNLIVAGATLVNDTNSVGGPLLPTLPAGYVRSPEFHAAYKIHEEEEIKWKLAEKRCIAEGGYLAIIDSFEKVQHINSLRSDLDKWFHVGIHKLTDDSEWVRADNGLPPSSIPWMILNPKGFGNCAGISYSRTGLVDYPCWYPHPYACEIPI